MKLVQFSVGKDSQWLECHKQTCDTRTKCSSEGEEGHAEQELNGWKKKVRMR